MKVVINRCFGGFSLSDELKDELGWRSRYFSGFNRSDNEERSDPDLIAALERKLEKGEPLSWNSSVLKIVEIPDDVDWYISDYDGIETIHEKHRSWC